VNERRHRCYVCGELIDLHVGLVEVSGATGWTHWLHPKCAERTAAGPRPRKPNWKRGPRRAT